MQLQTMFRFINDTKNRSDHLNVFREFLDHLDRTVQRRTSTPASKSTEEKTGSHKRLS